MARVQIVVVVAVDQGPASLAAFHKAVRVFRRHPAAAFHLVHVRPDPDMHRAGAHGGVDKLYDKLFADFWTRMDREHEVTSAEVLRDYSQRAMDEGIQFTAVEVFGPTTQALKEYCSGVGADLLVVGTLKRFLLPTVHRPMFLWCHGKKNHLRQMRVTG